MTAFEVRVYINANDVFKAWQYRIAAVGGMTATLEMMLDALGRLSTSCATSWAQRYTSC